jgi:hypothetical protein
MFTSDQIALTDAVNDIKKDWACEEHDGTCYINEKGDHLVMNRFRLDAWGRAIVSRISASL